MYQLNYKKYFLITLIVALLISALIGIFVFLVGEFGDLEVKLLLTTLAIGGYSLTGLCSSTIHNQNNLKTFSIIGMLISVLGFLITISAIWEIIDFEDDWRLLGIFMILSIAFGHISLLLMVKPNSDKIKNSMIATIIFISIITLMLINSTIREFDEEDFYYRLLGVFAILNILGTIAIPILNKITDKNK